jgi:SAM-dependent methyltransferase
MYRLHHVAREIAANLAMSIPPVRLARANAGRTGGKHTQAKAKQIRREFDFFAGTIGSIAGKTIVEVGPGDTLALGALFLKYGAARYIAFDRFMGDVLGNEAEDLYRELNCRLDPSKISIRRASIESVDPMEEEPADCVVSFNVLEHLKDPHIALKHMAQMLKPDGVMVHRVDYSPHDVWSSYKNPLSFLTIPEPLWALMGSHRGYPNRVRHCELLGTLKQLGLNYEDRITKLSSPSELSGVRGRLVPRFKNMPDEHLLPLIAEISAGKNAPPLGASYHY